MLETVRNGSEVCTVENAVQANKNRVEINL
jgi:hypothetical protein